MLRFIYLLTKLIHPSTTILACVNFFLAAGISDYYVMELGQTEPAMFKYLLICGFVLLIPAVIHAMFNLLIELARMEKKHNALHR